MVRRFGRRRHARGAFTLIEILIALVVLFIGIVGIIALFPIGIRSTKESVEDTNSALIAESVHHALIQALRAGTPAGTRIRAVLVHDGAAVAGMVGADGYTFFLPQRPAIPAGAALPTVPEWHHPGGQVSAAPVGPFAADPQAMQMPFRPAGPYAYEVFRCGDTQNAIQQTVVDIRGAMPDAPASLLPGGGAPQASDVTLDYAQYFYDFWISPVYVQRGGNWEGLPLYQFRIRVFRNYTGGGSGPGSTANPAMPYMNPGLPIHEFRVLIASNS